MGDLQSDTVFAPLDVVSGTSDTIYFFMYGYSFSLLIISNSSSFPCVIGKIWVVKSDTAIFISPLSF